MILRSLLAIMLGGLSVLGAIGKEAEPPSISFNDHVRPILSDKCYACHGPDPENRAADLRLDTEQGAFADLGGYRAITPSDPEESEIFWRIESNEEDDSSEDEMADDLSNLANRCKVTEAKLHKRIYECIKGNEDEQPALKTAPTPFLENMNSSRGAPAPF